jgi:Skp family chaperone for outer membrane proteins
VSSRCTSRASTSTRSRRTSSSKAGTIAADLKAFKDETKETLKKLEADVAAKLAEVNRAIATMREEARRDERRAQRPQLVSQPSGSFPSIEALTDLQRHVAEQERRLIAAESAIENVERRAERIERVAEELAREVREALRKLEVHLVTIATRLEERVARRADRGSHG